MVEKELSKQGILNYHSAKIGRKIIRKITPQMFKKKVEFDKEKVKSILFIQNYGIGDYLMATPTINAIAKDFPKAKKIVLCKEHNKDFAKITPGIDKVVTTPREVGKVDLIVSLNDSAEATLIAWKLKPKYAIGFLRGEKVSTNFDIKHTKKAKNITDWQIGIANALKIEVKDKSYKIKIPVSNKVKKMISKNKLTKFVVLNSNAREGAEAKNWGNENYAELAEKFIVKGYQIVFCGAKDEKNSSETIKHIHNSKKVFDFTGKLNLLEVAYLFSKAKLFVGNDTGLMHIAIAAKCKTIGIFGPTDSKRIFPKVKFGKALQVKNKEWPCYKTGTFDIKPNQKYMDSIKPETVHNESKKLLR